MIYVVTGYMRMGTSAMMACLHKGGMDPLMDPARDALKDRWADADYDPNPDGMYELTTRQVRQTGFPLMHDERLMKLLAPSPISLLAHNYRIVMMRRDPGEAAESYRAISGGQLPPYHGKALDRMLDEVTGILRMRRDVDLTVIRYRECLIDHPLETFQHLRERGWPIDPDAAAEIVNPDLCRYRKPATPGKSTLEAAEGV